MTLMLFNNDFINNNLLFLQPEWAHSELIHYEAEAMRARGIIIIFLVKSNKLVKNRDNTTLAGKT